MERILKRLPELEREFKELERELGRPELAGTRRYAELSQRYAKLGELLQLYRKLERLEREIAEAQELLRDETTDEELRRLAAEELEQNEKRREELIHEISLKLIPTDPRDAQNAIVEIRAGAGGEESALFAADLFRMYQKFAERKGLKIDVMDSHPTPLGGFKSIIFAVEGRGAYGLFKYESGVHRVQRVPVTESSGRIHTSTASVAVLPEAGEVEVQIDEKDLEVETFRSSGPGGQHANVTDSAVRIVHKPTGITVTCQDARSQHKNKEKALRILRARLKELLEQEKEQELAEKRRAQIGRAMRAEKVRTYNFPQNRVTDHRIDLTLYRLEDVLEGELDELIEALAQAEREERLAQVLQDASN